MHCSKVLVESAMRQHGGREGSQCEQQSLRECEALDLAKRRGREAVVEAVAC